MSGGSVPAGSCRRLGDALGDELPRAVVVGVGLELDRDLGHAELGVRAHAAHVGQPGERDLERNGDGGLQLLGAHRRVLRDDVEDRRRQVGEDVARQSCSQNAPIDGARPRPAARSAAARGTTRESAG